MVLAYTDEPDALMEAIRNKMPALKTWVLDDSGDLIHATAQYEEVGYFTVDTEEDHVVFSHAFFSDAGVARHEKPAKSAQMQGHLVSMLLTHFYDLISSVEATR